jgi:hypothetical protein
MPDQCCGGDLGYLLLQINVICLLVTLIGPAAWWRSSSLNSWERSPRSCLAAGYGRAVANDNAISTSLLSDLSSEEMLCA